MNRPMICVACAQERTLYPQCKRRNHIAKSKMQILSRDGPAHDSVGLHTDQLTCLGPYPTIASLSLGKDHSCGLDVRIH